VIGYHRHGAGGQPTVFGNPMLRPPLPPSLTVWRAIGMTDAGAGLGRRPRLVRPSRNTS
jgi:hypothetical protein